MRGLLMPALAALVALVPASAAEIAGPIPPSPYSQSSAVAFTGVVQHGETDDTNCTVTQCPAFELCRPSIERVRIMFSAQLLPGNIVTLSNYHQAWPVEGPVGLLVLDTYQADSCAKYQILGTRLDVPSPYVLVIEFLGPWAGEKF